MKQKNFKFLLAALLFTSLSTSCIYSGGFRFIDIINGNSTSTEIKKIKGDVDYKTPVYPSSYTKSNLNKDNIAIGLNQRYLPSTGNTKLLVIPVEFSDGDRFTNNQLLTIQNTFFGEKSDTGWESAKSFYSTSSYGKMNLDGIVTSPVTANYSLAEIEKASKSSNFSSTSISDSILVDAVKKVASQVNLSDYDTNNDGYIDGVWMVYNYPYESSSDLFWAYTYWTTKQDTISGKKVNLYAWASYDFLYHKQYYALKSDKSKAGDAHTVIHETGHMLGLDDYYTNTRLASSNSYESPVGGVDMMDNNIIDHMAYSKYALNWIKPTVLTESYLNEHNNQITINSLAETGESYILPIYKDGQSKYNDTPFDEYLILETYTPTSLNYQDAMSRYESLQAPARTGLRVYHVDARVGKLTVDSKAMALVWDGCSYDRIPDNTLDDYSAYYYLYSNNSNYSYGTLIDDSDSSFYRTRLVSLLPKNGRKPTSSNSMNASSLYVEGDSFLLSGGSYTNFKFDDGSKPQYGFEVIGLENNTSVTLSFSKIQ